MNYEIQIPFDGGNAFTPPFKAGEKLAIQFNVEERQGVVGTLTHPLI